MEYYEYEIVNKLEGLPIKAFFVSIDYREFHWHSDLELIWVLKGSVDLQFSDENIRLKERDIYLVNTNTVHRLKHTEQGNLLLALQIDDDIVSNYYKNLGRISFDRNFTVTNREFAASLERLLATVMLEIVEGKEFNLMKAVGNVHLLLSFLFQNIPYSIIDKSAFKTHGYDLERLKRIITFMNKHYQHKISLQELADTEYISRSRISHFITEKLGIGFKQLLNHIRLEHALKMLLKDSSNIADIARECGFSDQKYLNKMIKAEYNLTPSEYRNKIKKLEESKQYQDDKSFQDMDRLEALKLMNSIIEPKGE